MYYVKGKEGMLMRRKLLAAVSIVALLAMESMTVFATESGTGRPSPNSSNVLTGNAGSDTTNANNSTDTTTVTTPAVTTPQLTSLGSTTTTENGVKTTTTTFVSNTTDSSGEKKTVTVTTKDDDGTITVQTSSTTKTFNLSNAVKVAQDTDSPEKNDISSGSSKTTLIVLTEETISKSTATATLTAEELSESQGATALSTSIVDVEGELDDNKGLKLQASNVKKGDPVYVLHYDESTGEWEVCEAVVDADGMISITVPSGRLSPFIIIKLDKEVTSEITPSTDYTSKPATNTVSGATSPKTAEAEPYKTVAALAIIAIAAAAVCSRKITNK
jgi:hypothetical protein